MVLQSPVKRLTKAFRFQEGLVGLRMPQIYLGRVHAMFLCVSSSIHTCIHTYIHIYMYLMYVYLYIYYIRAYIFVYIYIYKQIM